MKHEKKSICDAPSGHVGNGFLAIFGGPQVPCSFENNLKYSKNGRKLNSAFWKKEDCGLAVRIKSVQAA